MRSVIFELSPNCLLFKFPLKFVHINSKCYFDQRDRFLVKSSLSYDSASKYKDSSEFRSMKCGFWASIWIAVSSFAGEVQLQKIEMIAVK